MKYYEKKKGPSNIDYQAMLGISLTFNNMTPIRLKVISLYLQFFSSNVPGFQAPVLQSLIARCLFLCLLKIPWNIFSIKV